MIEEILAIMAERGITQKEMSEMIGVTENTFLNKGKCRGDFTVAEMEKMCMVLGLEPRLEDTGKGWDIDEWRRRHHPEQKRKAKKPK